MWLVTWEAKDNGEWVCTPEGPFRTKKDAVKYMRDEADALLPKNKLGLYRCEKVFVHLVSEHREDHNG